MGFARDWGYGRLMMLNLFPYRAKSPQALYDWYTKLGVAKVRLASLSENARHILTECHRVQDAGGAILAAWGSHGRLLGQSDNLGALLEAEKLNVACLGHTVATWEPKHPLYLLKTTRPETHLGDGGPLARAK